MEKILQAVAIAKGTAPPAAQSPRHVRGARPSTAGDGVRRVAVPPELLERGRIVAQASGSPHSVGIDILRTKVLHEMRSRSWRTLMLTSPTAGCGKTVTAINLAMSMSRQPETTIVLVDCDLRRPQVATVLGLDASVGITQLLAGKASLSDALLNVSAGSSTILVLPAKGPVENPSELLASQRMAALVSELKALGRQTIVIFDLPPILFCDDVLAFLPNIDGVLLAVAANQSKAHEVASAERNIPESKYLGAVLTKSQEVSDRYHYY